MPEMELKLSHRLSKLFSRSISAKLRRLCSAGYRTQVVLSAVFLAQYLIFDID